MQTVVVVFAFATQAQQEEQSGASDRQKESLNKRELPEPTPQTFPPHYPYPQAYPYPYPYPHPYPYPSLVSSPPPTSSIAGNTPPPQLMQEHTPPYTAHGMPYHPNAYTQPYASMYAQGYPNTYFYQTPTPPFVLTSTPTPLNSEPPPPTLPMPTLVPAQPITTSTLKSQSSSLQLTTLQAKSQSATPELMTSQPTPPPATTQLTTLQPTSQPDVLPRSRLQVVPLPPDFPDLMGHPDFMPAFAPVKYVQAPPEWWQKHVGLPDDPLVISQDKVFMEKFHEALNHSSPSIGIDAETMQRFERIRMNLAKDIGIDEQVLRLRNFTNAEEEKKKDQDAKDEDEEVILDLSNPVIDWFDREDEDAGIQQQELSNTDGTRHSMSELAPQPPQAPTLAAIQRKHDLEQQQQTMGQIHESVKSSSNRRRGGRGGKSLVSPALSAKKSRDTIGVPASLLLCVSSGVLAILVHLCRVSTTIQEPLLVGSLQ
eukprot:gnl/MRDRNA2_/MRDRNA2_83237_c0_seq2.p1 gnl/MRDRNA2_/MRDRNA2_83237_c0~~gnl/MRDRNA2_/MRDRNA2_83237_c0_seq2.p1  ORF type:complete len:483 (-),score=64.79 gnl/MRDRNA2_/MRDRNA2_83237_c0_seq2:98-1546(-)